MPRTVETDGCEGFAASWCPNCGDCTCPRFEDGPCSGEIVWEFVAGYELYRGLVYWSETAHTLIHYDPACPLHAYGSAHAERELGLMP